MIEVEAIIKDDPELLVMWREEMKHQGERSDLKPEGNIHNNVMDVTPPRQGNSKSYTISRLEREAPELFAQVKDGTLSAHAAAIQAGFRKPTISLPLHDPIAAAGRLARSMEREKARELAEELLKITNQ